METCGKNWKLYGELEGKRPLVVLNTVADEGEKVWLVARKMTDKPFALLSIPCPDWNRYMTPWPFRNFGGEADTYIREIGKTVESLEITPAFICIAGYSLGGLFALYSLYKTNLFSRAASISGSLWFPRFKKFIETEKIQAKPLCLYFSLGKKEASTRNMYLKHIQMDTEAIVSYFSEKGIDVMYHLNPGGHFTNPEKRTADGLKWLLEEHDENKES